MTPDLPSLISQLTEARQARGFTQSALAARVGIPQSHLSKIEAGKNDIRLSTLLELTRALDLRVDLVGKKTERPTHSVTDVTGPVEVPTSPSSDQARAYRREQDWLSID
jgi:transcriptional regulator with XRE-family HTH domain